MENGRNAMMYDKRNKRRKGFTVIELLVTLSMLGALAGIAVPIAKAYIMKAEYAALQTTLEFLMDAEDLYRVENDEYFPKAGVVYIDRGKRKSIPELNYTFPSGHRHRYYIYGYNRELWGWKYNYYYIMVYSDFDFNKNGYDDMFILITYFRNDDPVYIRKVFQYQ
jgi:prepilin-type N-terminal cleavage/methylation domain-containing protein